MKNLDQKGRLRNKIISFRMSKEEAELLDRRVLMSGLTKQDFIVDNVNINFTNLDRLIFTNLDQLSKSSKTSLTL